MADEQWTVFSRGREGETEEERRQRLAWEAARREAAEKERWIAERMAEDRAAARRKALRVIGTAAALVLLLTALIFLGIPGFDAYRAREYLAEGNEARAEELYRQAAKWDLFEALFHPAEKADALSGSLRQASCTAGVPDREIPKGAVRLSGTAQGRSGPITVEIIVDRERIYRVAVTAHSEEEEIGGEAARQLPERIFRAQSLQVDAVSGATISSQAILRAAAEALNSDRAWAAGIYAWRFGAITPMPSPSPTQGPAPQAVSVFYYETELEEFTEKVGETVRLRAVAYPEEEFAEAAFRWSVSDERVLKITVSESTRECVVLCLKQQSGYVTLTLDCNGVTKEIRVYTRN